MCQYKKVVAWRFWVFLLGLVENFSNQTRRVHMSSWLKLTSGIGLSMSCRLIQRFKS